nr:DUF1549 domain-containing protein [Verrucomicrobium spinosum]
MEAFAEAMQAGRGNAVYEAAVDHYLASPAYGENMARMWLDYAATVTVMDLKKTAPAPCGPGGTG